MSIIFVSYSHKNSNIKDEFAEVLKEYHIYGNQVSFIDDDIKNGQEWEDRIYKEIDRASIVVFLITKEWIDSCWCQKEYSLAKMLGKVLIPVNLAKSEEEFNRELVDIFGKHIQQNRVYSNGKYHFGEIIQDIKKLIEEIEERPYPWNENQNPYPGPNSYGEEYAAVFYGRNGDINAIIETLYQEQNLRSKKLYLILGASGAGKSSVLKAGVLKRLKDGKEQDEWVVFDTLEPRERPFSDFLNSFVSKMEAINKRDDIEEAIKAGDSEKLEDILNRIINNFKLKYSNKRFLIPIDQGEELFTMSKEEERDYFFRLLEVILLDFSDFYTIWTIRNEYLTDLEDYITKSDGSKSLNEVKEYIPLDRIKKENIKITIEYPAKKSNIEFEKGLVDVMYEDLGDTTAMPLLAMTLERLTKEFFTPTKIHSSRRLVTIDSYKSLANNSNNPIHSIIESIIQKIYRDRSSIQQDISEDEFKDTIKRLFIDHLVNIEDDRATKKIAYIDNLTPIQQKIAHRFVDDRLLISSSKRDGEIKTVEIAHDFIITNWSDLKLWIKEEEDNILTIQQIKISYRQWKNLENKYKKDALLKGIILQKSKDILDKPWTSDEIQYIIDSINYKHKTDLYRRGFIFGFFGVISGLAIFGNIQYLRATRTQMKYLHELGLNYAEKAKYYITKKMISIGKIYAIKSLYKINLYEENNREDNEENQNIFQNMIGYITCFNNMKLLNIEKNILYTETLLTEDGNYLYAITKEGKLYKINTLNFNKIKIDTKDKKYSFKAKNKKNGINTIVFSIDNKYLYLGYFNGDFKILSLEEHKIVFHDRVGESPIKSIVSSKDEIFIAIDDSIYKIDREFDPSKYLEIYTKYTSSYKIKHLDMTSDYKYLLISYFNEKISVFDLEKGIFLDINQIHNAKVNTIKKHPLDRLKFFTTSDDGTIVIWNIDENVKIIKPIEIIKFGLGANIYLDISSNGKILVISTSKGKLIIYNLDKKDIEEVKNFKYNNIKSLTLSKDMNYLYVSVFNNIFYKYNINPLIKPTIIEKGHSGRWTSVSQNNDNNIFATGDSNGILKIWDKNSMLVNKTFYRHNNDIYDIVFYKNGRKIITASKDNNLLFWDILNPNITPFKKIKHNGRLYSLTLNYNETFVAVACQDGNIYIYNLKNYKYRIYTINEESYSIKFIENNILVISKENTLILVKVNTRSITKIKTLELNNKIKKIYNMAYSIDEKILYIATDNSFIYGINIFNDSLKLTIFKGHEKQILSIVIKDKYLISSSRDNSIILWDREKSIYLYKIKNAHQDRIYHISLLDNKRIISVSWDGSAKIWEISKNKLKLNTILKEFPSIQLISHNPITVKLKNNIILTSAYIDKINRLLIKDKNSI